MLRFVGRMALISLVMFAAAGVYIAAPFYTAWTIREAVLDNDSTYLERKIAWTSVRATLKDSLSAYAVTTAGELASPPEKPTWWQQTKAYFGRGAIERFVESTVTPTGLHAALKARKQYQSTFESPEDRAKKPTMAERARELWSRTRRAVFTRTDRLELEMADEYEPQRTIATVLELRGFEWIMTELRIKPTSRGNSPA